MHNWTNKSNGQKVWKIFLKKTSTLFAFHLSNYAILDFNLQLVDEHREPRPDLRGIIERSAAKMPFQSYFTLLFDILFRHFRFLRKFSILPYFSSIFSHISQNFLPYFSVPSFRLTELQIRLGLAAAEKIPLKREERVASLGLFLESATTYAEQIC